ncbi:MAG: hypothetical protein ABFD89_04805 [Bryobacteraceae bacterium]
MTIQIGKFSNFVEGIAKKVEIGARNAMKEAIYPQFTTVGSSKKLTEREQDIENMGDIPRWMENTPLSEMEFFEGFAKAHSQEQWGGIVLITKPMVEFQQNDLVDRLARQLKVSATAAKELMMHAYLEYGDEAVASVPSVGGTPLIDPLGGDGLALFHTAHIWKSTSSYTYPNKSASLDSISETSINTIHTRLGRITDNAGRPLNIGIKRLIVPVELQMVAEQTLLSQYDPLTANNAINTAPRRISNKAPLVSKWLSSATDWYAQTDAMDGDLRMWFGWQDAVKRGDNPDPKMQGYFISLDFSVSHGANRLLSLYKVTA